MAGKIRMHTAAIPKDNIATKKITISARSITPAVIVNGNEWRSWRRSDLPPDQALVLNIAILGFDLTSKVKKGENTGRTLKHEFVVLGYRSVGMQATQAGHFNVNNIALPTTSINSTRTALATWVSTAKDQAPLQDTGGWLN